VQGASSPTEGGVGRGHIMAAACLQPVFVLTVGPHYATLKSDNVMLLHIIFNILRLEVPVVSNFLLLNKSLHPQHFTR